MLLIGSLSSWCLCVFVPFSALSPSCYIRSLLFRGNLAVVNNASLEMFSKTFSSLVLLLSFISSSLCGEASDLLSTLDQKLNNYDKRLRPNAGLGPVHVEVTAYILRVYDYDEVNQVFKVDMYVRQLWNDKRLEFAPRYGENDTIYGGADIQSRIWVPDTFSSTSPNVKLSSVINPNTFTRISNNGNVFISNQITFEVVCDGWIASFPFERKDCYLRLESCK